ncbi:MAG: hypothetical protein GY794_19590 [bacterium]|nr:hypothetical protein [bacterium]
MAKTLSDNMLKLLHQYASILLIIGLFGVLYTSTIDSHGVFMWDEAEYASIGRSVLDGAGFSIDGRANALRPPLLPLAGSTAILVSGSTDDVTLKYMVVLFALLGLALLYHSVRLAHAEGAALLAVIILGLSPSFWQHTSYFLSEIPFLTFFLGAVLYMHHGLYTDQRYFKYSWMCFGLAMLTRYTAVLFGPILILMLSIAFLVRDGNEEIRSRIFSKTFFLTPLVAAGILTPWLVRQQLTFGDALAGFKQASGQLQVYMPDVSMSWSFYLVNVPYMITWIGVSLMLVGVVWTLRKRDLFGLNCILVSLFLLVWFSFYRFKEVRLITSILPFLAVLAALGSMELLKQFIPRMDPRLWAIIVALVLGVNSYLITKPFFTQYITKGHPVLNQALSFIKNNSADHAVIMGSIGPQLFWYTRRKITHIPGRGDLKVALDSADWVILVNFEHGQPRYATKLLSTFTRIDVEEGRIHVFANPQFQAYVISAEELKKRL